MQPTTPAASVMNRGSYSRLVFETSSSMPMVKWFLGDADEIVEHAFDHRRGELLGREAVAPPDNSRHLEAAFAGHRLGEGRHRPDTGVRRTHRVPWFDRAPRPWRNREQRPADDSRKWSEQVHLDYAQLRPAAIQ